MRLAIVSDTHSRYGTVDRVLHLLEPRKVDLIIHCGDIEDAETIAMFPANTHYVFGNCDTDRDELRQAIRKSGGTLHEPYGHLELEGVSLAFIHSDDRRLMNDLEKSDAYQFIFYGHTHVAREHQSGTARVINPGALHRAQPKSFIILELPSGDVETITLT
jgi:uncharacterized protein